MPLTGSAFFADICVVMDACFGEATKGVVFLHSESHLVERHQRVILFVGARKGI